ncbi:AAA family ATPase [Nitrospiraceae bacterium AH_259_D15_M11_P09]|nr:AAA family ATPase [Nitrospiraceae bacterium AH_259_D15_M11_P09]
MTQAGDNSAGRTLKRFLRALFDGCDGVIELRSLPSKARSFLSPGDDHLLTKFIGDHLSENLFLGIATRKDASSGALANCQDLGALFTDIDFKSLSEEEARKRLADFALPPSIIVHSGGGLHCYWLLRESLNLTEEAPLAKNLLRRLALYFHADLNSAEPAHILRLPGTSNHKYAPARWVRIEASDDERRYNVSEFEELLPQEPSANGDRRQYFRTPEIIEDGFRNKTLYRAARSLKAQGYAQASILAAVRAENEQKCEPPLESEEVVTIVTNAWTQADQPGFEGHSTQTGSAKEALASEDTTRFAIGLGSFLAQEFPPTEPLIEGLLSDEGGGWLGGEEKLGKTYYALEEALCLALGVPVCGRFKVPKRRRVLFIEEEDPPRRTHRRLCALLCGHGYDPEDPAHRVELDEWFRIEVWEGFTFDNAEMVRRLGSAIADFRPDVVYLDVLRKLTTCDLNKAQEASKLLATLEDLRRRYRAIFRIVHHYRKTQGFRSGRGSQEIGGSYVLGAWGENSLFFEPLGRKQGPVRVEIQSKDSPPQPAFQLTIRSEEEPGESPRIVLVAEDVSFETAAEKLKEQVFEAVASLAKTEAQEGEPGILREDICKAVKRSDRPVRTALNGLQNEHRIKVVGKATRQRLLYDVLEQKTQ